MKLALLSFSKKGLEICQAIQALPGFECSLYDKSNYKEQIEEIYSAQGVVFCCSIGIAVRVSAPFLQSKAHDPAILVIDDMGRYCISLVSGHLGGANALALELAQALGLQPIITTASDGRGFEAVDLYAQRLGLALPDLKAAKEVTALMLENRPVKLLTPGLPPIDYPNLVEEGEELVISVGHAKPQGALPQVVLVPRCLNLGMGCRKDWPAGEIMALIQETFEQKGFYLEAIKSLNSIEHKAQEPGLIQTAQGLGVPFRTFSKDDIARVQGLFPASELVQKTLGVTAVCEPAAYLAGGEVIVDKIFRNGVTLAIAKE